MSIEIGSDDEWFIELVDEHGDRYWSGTYGGGYGLADALSNARDDCAMEFGPSRPGYEFRVRPIGEILTTVPY